MSWNNPVIIFVIYPCQLARQLFQHSVCFVNELQSWKFLRMSVSQTSTKLLCLHGFHVWLWLTTTETWRHAVPQDLIWWNSYHPLSILPQPTSITYSLRGAKDSYITTKADDRNFIRKLYEHWRYILTFHFIILKYFLHFAAYRPIIPPVHKDCHNHLSIYYAYITYIRLCIRRHIL